jgi:hypothetical protein
MQPLLLLSLLLLAAPAWSAGPFLNILDYGARNDASAPATEAIRSAIQAAKSTVLEGNALGSARKPTAEAKANYWTSAEPPTEAESATPRAK